MIAITAERLEVAKLMLGHIPGALPKAISLVINRATEGARTDAVRKVREEYVITAARVRETIAVKKANPTNLAASIVSRGRPRALSYFKLSPGRITKRRPPEGVRAQVKRSGGGIIPKSFIAKMKSGHVGVFNRQGSGRFPIVQRYGPSVAQMVGSASVVQHVEKSAESRLDARLDHEINRILQRYRK